MFSFLLFDSLFSLFASLAPSMLRSGSAELRLVAWSRVCRRVPAATYGRNHSV
jgi:hypothetical protein